MMGRLDRARFTIEQRMPMGAIILALSILMAVIWLTPGCVGVRSDVSRPTLQEAQAITAQQVLVTTLATACRQGDQVACDRLVVEDRVLMKLLEMWRDAGD